MASGSPALAARSSEPWWMAEPVIERHGPALVVRDDLLAGGSKIRFLPHIVGDAREIVFGGPFCGGAPYALAVWGARTGARITLFYAKRRELHWRQRAAFQLGSQLYQVPAGRMTVVQRRARDYAADHGALFLPLGFDLKHATDPFVAVMRRVRECVGPMDEVWCATGSGMLARCLANAFPEARIKGVVVGLRSRNQAQQFPGNVELIDCPYDFAEPSKTPAPFPCCRNYDAKAWEQLIGAARAPHRRVLFWNVAGDQMQDLEELR
jgi:hypothetical protein